MRTGEESPEAVRTSKLPRPAQLAEGVNKDTVEHFLEQPGEPRPERGGDSCGLRE